MKYKMKTNPNKIILESLWYKIKAGDVKRMLKIFTFWLYLQNHDHKNKYFLCKQHSASSIQIKLAKC